MEVEENKKAKKRIKQTQVGRKEKIRWGVGAWWRARQGKKKDNKKEVWNCFDILSDDNNTLDIFLSKSKKNGVQRISKSNKKKFNVNKYFTFWIF